MSKERLFVGLDLSLSETGLVAITSKGGLIDDRVLKVKKGVVKEERLSALAGLIDDWLEGYSDRIEAVGIEHYAMGARNQLAQCGEWGGLVRVMLHRRGLPFLEIAPTSLKLYATGQGNSKGKTGVVLAVMRKYGHEFPNDNIADACVLAFMARAMATGQGSGPKQALLDYERRALQKPYLSTFFQKKFPRIYARE